MAFYLIMEGIKMKGKVFTKKLLIGFLAIVFVTCFALGISKAKTGNVIAGEPEAKVEIVACNLSFQDSIKLMYAVEAENIAEADFNKIEVLVWKSGKKKYKKPTNNYSLSLYRIEEIQGKKYAIFLNDQIKAKEVGDNLYAVPYYSNGQSEVYGEVVKYSALDYAFDMRGSKESNVELDKVITSMLNYSSATQEMTDYKEDRLVNSKFYQIKVHGGVLEDESARGLFKKGEQIQITSTTENFVCWVDSRDVVLSYEPTFTYTVSRNDVIKASTVQIEPDYDSNGLVYEKINDNEYRLIGLGTCTAKNIVVPKYYNEKPVTQVDNAVFKNNTNITSVTFDGGFDNFTQSMFNGCSSLERLVISGMFDKDLYWLFGESINDIPETFVEIEFAKNSNYMDYSMFKGSSDKKLCNHTVTVVLPEDTTEIRSYEFDSCYALQSIIIPESVTTISNCAFQNCTGLTEIILPESLISIYDLAFQGCKFESLFIGKNVNFMPASVFSGLKNLQNVEIDSENKKYCVKGNCIIEKETKTLIKGFNNSIIPADGSVEIIGDGSFERCDFTTIDIPNGIKEIRHLAFGYCSSLTTLEIPESVIYVDSGAFANDIQLYEKYQGVYYVDNWAIVAVNNTLIKVEFKPGTIGVAGGCFSSCNLEEFSLEGIKYIGASAFMGSLSRSLIIPDSVKIIGDNAFQYSSFTKVVVNGVTNIGNYAFAKCPSLENVIIGDGVKSIGGLAFYDCSSLTSVTIGSDVKSIGSFAFEGCDSLTKVYYKGTEGDWSNINILIPGSDGYIKLTQATRYYYSETEPQEAGNYWHYDTDGETVLEW